MGRCMPRVSGAGFSETRVAPGPVDIAGAFLVLAEPDSVISDSHTGSDGFISPTLLIHDSPFEVITLTVASRRNHLLASLALLVTAVFLPLLSRSSSCSLVPPPTLSFLRCRPGLALLRRRMAT